MNKIFFYVFFAQLLYSTITFGQDIPTIQTDRPDQTECPFIVPTKFFQFETGFNFEKNDADSHSFLYPTILTRFGINKYFELRMVTELTSTNEANQQLKGINPISFGFKSSICQEKGLIPTIAFIGHFTVPKLASESLKSTFFAPSFRFTMQHTLNENTSLSYNLGAEWDGFSPEPTFIYTLSTGFNIINNLGGFVEVYGFAHQKNKTDHRFLAGITYLINPNFQLDFSTGLGISKNAPKLYSSLGVSFRIKN